MMTDMKNKHKRLKQIFTKFCHVV